MLAPEGEINFDDAAIFWTAFYHLMFKGDRRAMHRSDVIENVRRCASLVGQKFWFLDRRGGKFTSELLG